MKDARAFVEKMDRADLTDYQPIPFWSWNDRLEPVHLQQQIRQMKQVGMGGFFMHARGGLETEYLSQEWFAAVTASMEEAKRQGMNAWCYDENGWPSGFAGGKLLEDPANWVHYLQFERRDTFPADALGVYVLDGTHLRRVLQPLAAGAEYLCVFDRTNSSAVDILNPHVTEQFIQETYDRYYAQYGDAFGEELVGFFTDEPQYFRWDTAYTPVLLQMYRETYGKDLLDQLGALFVDCDGCSGLRFRYWYLMNILYTENFIGKIYDWCNKHNCKITGHSVEESSLHGQMECCAGIMPFYEYEHIPGIDWLCRPIGATEMAPKQLASVAQQLGKKQAMTETFACVGWDVTPAELKHIAQWQYVNGVNLMCHHLYPYSIRGQRKRDYPAFYSRHNPWAQELGEFNRYFTRLGYMLAQSTEVAPVLILHPMHSAYLTFLRNDASSLRELEASFDTLIETFGAAGIGHHYADERLLEKYGSVSNGKITVGQCTYDYLVIPQCTTLDHNTAALVRSYLEQGGKLYMAGAAPTMIDGETADLAFLQGNISFAQIAEKTAQFVQRSPSVRCTLRQTEQGGFLYAVNLSQTEEADLTVKLPFAGAVQYDLDGDVERGVSFTQTADGILVSVRFAPSQAMILLQRDEALPEKPAMPVRQLLLKQPMQIVGVPENALTLDMAQLSYDGVTYTKPMYVMAISDHLLRQRQNRTVWLRYTFTVKHIPEKLALEQETMRNTRVFVNGAQIISTEAGQLDDSFVRSHIRDLVRLGENEVVLQVEYHQPEQVYHVFNEFYYGNGEVTETLVNCLSYETNVEAVYLFGDFSVTSTDVYQQAQNNALVTAGSFALEAPACQVEPANITAQGFPFFHGAMRLQTTVQLDSTDWKLRSSGRFQYCKVWANGQYAGMLLLKDSCDLSPYLRKGENRLELELMSSNRNLFGPFHVKGDPEPLAVTPDTFSRYGRWQEADSPTFTPEYAFVRFGMDVLYLEQ